MSQFKVKKTHGELFRVVPGGDDLMDEVNKDAGNSKAIAKFPNAEVALWELKMLGHDLLVPLSFCVKP